MPNKIEEVQHSIEMDEALQLHKAGWVIQRISWILFLLLLVLAALGLFGAGPLSHKRLQAAGNAVEYERYERFESSTELRFVAGSINGRAVLRIPQQYLQHFEVEAITPQPERTEIMSGYSVYSFPADGPVNIVLRGMLKKTGLVQTNMLVNNTRFFITQYVYP